ncbi:MAG: hypothetical protein JJU08_03965 [Rhodobacteraceae bacterium]|nr:hypothetical protein [Paracoccaceae bacterium]
MKGTHMHCSDTPQSRRLTLAVCLALPVLPLFLLPRPASADREMTDFAFEMIDPGFCAAPPPQVPDAQVRSSVSERPEDFTVRGEVAAPVSAVLRGDGFFARGSGRNAIASTIYTGVLSDSGAISFLCLALVPVNEMNLTEGDAMLRGPDGNPEEGDYYMVLGRILERDADGVGHVVGDLEIADGTLQFKADHGHEIEGRLALIGDMSDGRALDVRFDFKLIEDDYVRFIDLSFD